MLKKRKKELRNDVLTPEQRSYCMSRIRGKNTSPEMMLRCALWRKGLRYRTSYRLFGKPDIVFVAARVAIFVDGCFWHACPLHSTIPKTNKAFWRNKIKKNVKRDKIVNKELSKLGWIVLRFWEHEVEKNLNKVVGRTMTFLKSVTPSI